MDIRFNAHHSPVGAFASFTLGQPGASGGFGLELGDPARQSLYIGAERREQPGTFEALPFFAETDPSKNLEAFVMEDQGDVRRTAELLPIPWERIERRYKTCTDTWQAGDLTFTLYSPTWKLPEPDGSNTAEYAKCILPAVFAELTIDNREGTHPRRAFFGYAPDNVPDHLHELWNLRSEGLHGLANNAAYGLVTDAEDGNTAMQFAVENILGEPDRDSFHFSCGTLGIVDAIVPAGERRTLRFVLGFHRRGLVTSGRPLRYAYEPHFPDLESVLRYGMQHFETYREAALAQDREWEAAHLSAEQQFQLTHAIRSYYGSTQLLAEDDGTPVWVVNEGEYRMMNTLDLTVDQLFFELKQNPWTTRNVLETFVAHYSYEDEVFFPGQPGERFPGGLSFCHDMGIMNNFTQPGYSCYERPHLKGCFSYMTHEQLVNWLAAATTYVTQTGDAAWRHRYLDTFKKSLQSLLQRDHPEPAKRCGVMRLESSRTVDGGEITTYDSLDVSLGRARQNTYLAVKTWATYLALEKILREEGESELAATCADQARRGMETILAARKEDGTFPAVLDEPHPSVIIPIIEGLVFLQTGGREDALASDSPYAPLIEALRGHFQAILTTDRCLFPNGGWKLSSTSINSWLSKIYLCQYVARALLGVDTPAVTADADRGHVEWLLDPRNALFAWSDQCYDGLMGGSKYYPRGVTAVLWMNEG
ncbi:MAG: glycoside hydrolase family 52 protein [Opitutales bacterium]